MRRGMLRGREEGVDGYVLKLSKSSLLGNRLGLRRASKGDWRSDLPWGCRRRYDFVALVLEISFRHIDIKIVERRWRRMLYFVAS